MIDSGAIIEEIEMPPQQHLLQEQSPQSSSLLGNTSLIDSSDSIDIVCTV